MKGGASEARVLRFLRQEQQASGGFMGLVSSDAVSFRAAQPLPTIFLTTLIMQALSALPRAHTICAPAASYLLAQRTARGTWNYWERGSAASYTTPYPDDLDDTACALRALMLCAPSLVTAAMWADFARALVSAETAPGGPYHAWLAAESAMQNDCDVVVNSNIAAALAERQVRVQATEAYIDQALAGNNVRSAYYVGRVPILYFLAQWYRGAQLPRLRRLVGRELQKTTHTPLAMSMLLSASVALGVRSARLSRMVRQLEAAREFDHWPAEALYIQARDTNGTSYAGSAALTTALALRALHDYRQSLPTTPSQPALRLTKQPLRADSTLVPSELRQAYHTSFQRLVLRDRTQQITSMATVMAAAYNVPLDPETERHLNLASTNGWMAYTIYDDFLDGEGKPTSLGVGNVSLRQTVAHFRAAFSDSAPFARLVDSALNTIDAANHWEVLHARASSDGEALSSIVLPDYGSYRQLADKSWGHVLVACGIVLNQRRLDEAAELSALQQFFLHYLIARQLNDDAHDWEQDLLAGRLSAAVTLLLHDAAAPHTVTFAIDLPRLRLLFWEQTITTLATRIQREVQLARRALRRTHVVHPGALQAWLDPLEAAATEVLTKRAETKRFIAAYQLGTKG